MRSWVFRHRARLRALFCPREPEPERERPAPRARTAPGTLRRAGRFVVLVPMGAARSAQRRSA